jgi:hypothetical protein
MFSKKKVDSAQLLASLFIPLELPALIVGFSRFWLELVAYADAQGVKSKTIEELRGVSMMFANLVPGALTQGWGVVIDG